ncbi:MAG: PhoX family protein [Acidimicrobiales bacterium]
MSIVDDDIISNRSANPTFEEVVAERFSRRAVLGGSLAVAAATVFAGRGSVLRPGVAAASTGRAVGGAQARTPVGFTAIDPSTADAVVVPPQYVANVLYRWGDPIQPGGPEFEFDASNTAEEQAQQAGMGHDAIAYFPLARGPRGNRHGLLVMNHEFTEDELLFPDGTANWTAEKTAKSQNAHGVSVIEIVKEGRSWVIVSSMYARRITAQTPTQISGPAVGHRLLRTAADRTGTQALGTFNNCSYGQTPWNTYLACEENFNGYFATADPAWTPDPLQARYGLSAGGFGYLWHTTDGRFDLAAESKEANRHGWVTEINPLDPASTPIKRTALGRFKHESATVTLARDERVVVYSGDDERFEYIYKFVGNRPWKSYNVRRGESPLDDGTLYVARFDPDGTGEWLPLVFGHAGLTPDHGFHDQADVVIKARFAGDRLGATKMDRPEWVAVHPDTGEVYCTLTNNTARTPDQVDPPNPRGPNPFGHIIRWREAGGDNAATSFEWDLFVLAGAGEGSGDGSTIDPEDAFGSPDGLWFDAEGRLWIQTDGSQPIECNNQMLGADTTTADLRRFLVGPPGCEVTGVCSTPDGRFFFVNIQHPGEGAGPENPREISNWPDFRPDGRPRPATVVIHRADGGVVGT